MLAGRKLLLADDSVTVQKVIDLTFADEGVEVITVGDGAEAIEKVEQLFPDVVLVDVFMPVFNGYEVCEYIKTSEKLKHIPVMLLVGSFEPFDEAEARRVGADDILTKPFQSIRRLIEKVGDLVSARPSESEVPTAELPSHAEELEETRLSTAEIEITTADTMQLPSDIAHLDFNAKRARAQESFAEFKMENLPGPQNSSFSETNDTLLDLGELEPGQLLEADDFELELDEVNAIPAPVPFAAPALANSQVSVSAVGGWEETAQVRAVVTPTSQLQEAIDLQDVPPELIDAIARRAVEYLSERVVREIAWEVVPPLAELLIMRQLEEKES